MIQGCEQSWTKQDRLTSGYNWQVFHAKLRFSNVLAAVVNAADRVVKETLFSCTWMKRHEKQNWKHRHSAIHELSTGKPCSNERKNIRYAHNILRSLNCGGIRNYISILHNVEILISEFNAKPLIWTPYDSSKCRITLVFSKYKTFCRARSVKCWSWYGYAETYLQVQG